MNRRPRVCARGVRPRRRAPQLKSRITCPVCKVTCVKFDSCFTPTLPLPKRDMFRAYVLPHHAMLFSRAAPAASIADAKAEVAAALAANSAGTVVEPSRMIFAELSGASIKTVRRRREASGCVCACVCVCLCARTRALACVRAFVRSAGVLAVCACCCFRQRQ